MNTEIRVMICDDSAIMRRLIKTALQLEKSLEVVCEASHGRDAVEQLRDARPDIVIMDIEMPVMDGVEAVREIRKIDADLPVIMFSSLTSRGAEASLDAIAAGATDFATKPTGAGHIQQALESLRRDLVPKLLQWTARKRSGAIATGDQNDTDGGGHASDDPSESGEGIAAIGIAVSTGGPQALSKFLSGLPKDFRPPILIAQHMPPVFTGLLAQRLSDQTGHEIREAVDGEQLADGMILVAPGDHHLTVVRQNQVCRVKLNQDPPENSCRPSANPLFCSLADCYGGQALGIVMTGMGQDGVRGAKRIKSCGGRVFVQDKQSSVVWGMPGQVVESGCADRVLPIDQMANEAIRAVGKQSTLALSVSG